MKDHRAELGRVGEKIAEDYLKQQGYEVLKRRYRAVRKEIDLIVRQSSIIVFVEVKTDATGCFGSPEGWVTPAKQKAIITAARAYVATESPPDCEYRFDVIGISLRGRSSPEIHHLRGAFTLDG